MMPNYYLTPNADCTLTTTVNQDYSTYHTDGFILQSPHESHPGYVAGKLLRTVFDHCYDTWTETKTAVWRYFQHYDYDPMDTDDIRNFIIQINEKTISSKQHYQASRQGVYGNMANIEPKNWPVPVYQDFSFYRNKAVSSSIGSIRVDQQGNKFLIKTGQWNNPTYCFTEVVAAKYYFNLIGEARALLPPKLIYDQEAHTILLASQWNEGFKPFYKHFNGRSLSIEDLDFENKQDYLIEMPVVSAFMHNWDGNYGNLGTLNNYGMQMDFGAAFDAKVLYTKMEDKNFFVNPNFKKSCPRRDGENYSPECALEKINFFRAAARLSEFETEEEKQQLLPHIDKVLKFKIEKITEMLDETYEEFNHFLQRIKYEFTEHVEQGKSISPGGFKVFQVDLKKMKKQQLEMFQKNYQSFQQLREQIAQEVPRPKI